jgi:hypothetical protein
LHPSSAGAGIAFDAGFVAKPQLHLGIGAQALEFLPKDAAGVLVLALGPGLGGPANESSIRAASGRWYCNRTPVAVAP